MRYFIVVGLLVATAAGAQPAQPPVEPVEITPTAGYLFGGTLLTFPTGYSLNIADHFTYGLRVGYNATAALEPELQWSHAETSVGADTPPTPLTLDFFIVGLTYNFSAARLRPYLSLGVGALRFDEAYSRVQTLFTVSAALGAKYFISPHVGVRLEFRGYGSKPSDGIRAECSDCSSKWIFNGDLTGGLLVAF